MSLTVNNFTKRLEALRLERSSFIPLWRELSDYTLAHRGRFLTSDRNKGFKRNTKQYNNVPRLAARTLASGMMAGITSPARPWFRLSTPDDALAELAPVREWLHKVQSTMYRVFAQSNTYNSLYMLYSEIGVFGTASMGVYADYKNVIHCRPYTCGSYMIALDGQNRVDSFYREYELSVSQVIKQFGIENVSETVRRQWERGNTENWVKVVHVIEPNDDRDLISPSAEDKAVRSIYFEDGSDSRRDNKFLRKSGFDDFPILAPRWDITAEDVYATDCPAMTALGDNKALQLGERRGYQALDKLVDPPLQGSSKLRNKVGKSLRNGEIVWHDGNSQGLSSIYGNFKPDLNAMMQLNQQAEQRVQRAFYEDLFLMLANDKRSNVTAREISEKHEEKLLMLGSVLERLHTELLDPLIDITFNKLQAAGVLPPPPKELEGIDLKVTYISVLAQAQHLVSIGSLDRLGQYVGGLSQVFPEARHKFDAQQAVDEYADALGVAPKVVRSDDQVALLMKQEAEAAQKQQNAEAMANLANTAKTASQIDTGGENAVADLVKQMDQ